MLLKISVNVVKFYLSNALFADGKLFKKRKKIVVVFQKLKKLSWDFKHRVCLFDAGTGSVHKHQSIGAIALKAAIYKNSLFIKLSDA